MPRIRTLKPELWLSPQVMNLSHGARLLFLGLITQADDEGRGCADPRRLKAAIFGGDDCDASAVRAWIDEIVAQRLAITYDGGDHGDLYELPTWSEHQSIDRPKSSRYPPSTKNRRSVVESSPKDREGSEGSERIKDRKDQGSSRARARDDDSPGQAPKAAPELPPGLDPAAWKRWCDYRREIRKPLKPVSLPAAQRELAAFGCDQSAVVEQSVANGYQGLFALKSRSNGSGHHAGKPARRLRTADEIEAEEESRAGH